jgi:DNA-binding MarR family transcriptional regulator
MRLEDEIQQKNFKSDQQKAVINLLYTSGFLVNLFNNKAKVFDITRQQYNVLRILRGQHPKSASINLIKDRMLDKMSDASRIVERLRIKNLVVRKISDNDKRSVDISITEKGLKLLSNMEPSIDTIDNIFNNFSDQELKSFNEMLDKMRE